MGIILNESDNTAVIESPSNFVAKGFECVFSLFGGKNDGVTIAELRAGTTLVTTATVILTSMYTRKKVSEGREPFARVFF